MTIKIKEIPKDERPRERLIRHGVSNLSNEELLAILLKTGTKNNSAKDLASYILSKIGSIQSLADINYYSLSKIKGIGEAKACTILTAIELGKRVNEEVSTLQNICVNSADIVYKYFNSLFFRKKQEYFYAIYLDNKKKVIDAKLLFIGTLNCSIVHPREVFKEALMLSASSIICIHNHPSGSIEPSKDDIDLTTRLVSVGKTMGIPIVDHLIIGSNKYYSFVDNGILR